MAAALLSQSGEAFLDLEGKPGPVARRFGLDALGSGEYRELLTSLEEAEQEIDTGRGLSVDDLRQKLATWAGE